jgi:hypothetical protein
LPTGVLTRIKKTLYFFVFPADLASCRSPDPADLIAILNGHWS